MNKHGTVLKDLIIKNFSYPPISNFHSGSKRIQEQMLYDSKIFDLLHELWETTSDDGLLNVFYEIVHCMKEVVDEFNAMRIVFLADVLMSYYNKTGQRYIVKRFLINAYEILSLYLKDEEHYPITKMSICPQYQNIGIIKNFTSMGFLFNDIIEENESDVTIKIIKNNVFHNTLFYHYSIEHLSAENTMRFINNYKIIEYLEYCLKNEEFFMKSMPQGLRVVLNQLKKGRQYVDRDIIMAVNKLHVKYPIHYFSIGISIT